MFRKRSNILKHISCALLLAGAAACSTPKDVVYFQDVTVPSISEVSVRNITFKPNDKISIIVNSRDREVSDMFNLPYVQRQIGLGGGGAYAGVQSQGVCSYTINKNGDIDFPFLGELHVAGMTRNELAYYIKGRLIQADLVKDPIITVELLNGQYSVLGEVNAPGRYPIDRDNMTILDALGTSGDLTILGKRENVRLIRTENGKQETFILSLLDEKSLRESPAYFIQQDDVIYIEPNVTKVRQSSLNANTVLSTSFWISIASMAITLVAVILR